MIKWLARAGSPRSDLPVPAKAAGPKTSEDALRILSAPAVPAQEHWQRQPPRVVEQVFQNAPFEDYPRQVLQACRSRSAGAGSNFSARGNKGAATGGASLREAEAFLRRLFPSLMQIPEISFLPGSKQEQAEQRAVDRERSLFRQAGLDGQSVQLWRTYHGLSALRELFGRQAQQGGIRLRETAVPARFLPELLLAAPVWFIESQGNREYGRGSDNQTVRYFCDLGRTGPFACLFQIYNSRSRFFSEFTGADPMPLELAGLVADLRLRFDYLVIATPYHRLAAAEWGNPPVWPVSFDPFLFGFLKEAPDYMFFLGRWSGTGIFPLIGDMIAATLQHLLLSRQELAGTWSREFPWYPFKESSRPPRLPVRLPSELPLDWFVDRLLGRFQDAGLFPWLRGEAP